MSVEEVRVNQCAYLFAKVCKMMVKTSLPKPHFFFLGGGGGEFIN